MCVCIRVERSSNKSQYISIILAELDFGRLSHVECRSFRLELCADRCVHPSVSVCARVRAALVQRQNTDEASAPLSD